jgi:hypothetical protein
MTDDRGRVSIGRTPHGLTTITARFKGGAASFVIDREKMTEKQLVDQLKILAETIDSRRKKT